MVVDNLPIPTPSSTQILVKSVWTAINPVDAIMYQSGILVTAWPFTPGCDAGGIVVKAGSSAKSILGELFKVGDRVSGCTRLGVPGYSPYAEYFLMDAALALPVVPGMSLDKACTLGVAAYTAGLGLFKELKIPIPAPGEKPAPKDEWVLIFGGSSSVGKASLQIAKSLGYKVIATGSSRSADVIKHYGADEVVDYKQPEAAQIDEIAAKTGGKVLKVFDATAQNVQTAPHLFKKTMDGDKIFSSTNEWTPLDTEGAFQFNPVGLGPIGRPTATALNDSITSFLPYVHRLIQDKALWPSDTVVAGEGFDHLFKAYEFQQAGKGGNKKVIVKIADE